MTPILGGLVLGGFFLFAQFLGRSQAYKEIEDEKFRQELAFLKKRMDNKR